MSKYLNNNIIKFFSNQILNKYNDLIWKNTLTKDNRQIQLINELDNLSNYIISNNNEWYKSLKLIKYNYIPIYKKTKNNPNKNTSIFNFFKKQDDYEIDFHRPVIENDINNNFKGLYIVGSTGCGKTYLMDMMHDNLDSKNKLRMHFNEFMLMIHKNNFKNKNENNPLFFTCCEIAKKYNILFLDELQVTDIGDSVLMDRVFDILWKHGLTLVVTSNRIPDDLYKNGIQRETFLPFIDKIKLKTNLINLFGVKDYRIELFLKEKNLSKDFIDCQFYGINKENKDKLNNIYLKFAKKNYIETIKIEVIKGRNIIVNGYLDICRMNFDDIITNGIYGSSDFIAICKNFSILILDDIKIIKLSNKNTARKFILLVDEIYNHKVKLFFNSESELDNLFFNDLKDETEEVFMKKRCISRLVEMKTKKYFQEKHLNN